MAAKQTGDSEASTGLRIVYIVGMQNCGSTLLDAVLGNAAGARSLGQVGSFHRYDSVRPCDCRQRPETCRLCRHVSSTLATRGELCAFRRLSSRPLRARQMHWTLIATRRRAQYARLADVVFEAVARETGSSVLVDSSKNVARCAALVHESGHDVRVIHLLRDGRGYLASRRHRAVKTEQRYLPPVAMTAWLVKNLLISGLLKPRIPRDRYLLCRYEDLVTDPAAELQRIGEFAGLDTEGLAEAVTGQGVARSHLFEDLRRVDYRTVRLDPTRLHSQRMPFAQNLLYWACGGLLSKRWGYDREQSYLCRLEGAPR